MVTLEDLPKVEFTDPQEKLMVRTALGYAIQLEEKRLEDEGASDATMCYLRKYLRSWSYTLFYLSNRPFLTLPYYIFGS